MNQQQFPNACAPCKPFWVSTATYTARCPEGEPYQGGFLHWKHTGDGRNLTVNGLDLLRKEAAGWTFLALHDNNLPNTRRFSKIFIGSDGTVASQEVVYVPTIPGNYPNDVEGMCACVVAPTYFLVTSGAVLIRGTLDSEEDEWHESSRLTLPSGTQVEAVSIFTVGAKTVLAWASRGSNGTPATVYWGEFDWFGMAFTSSVQSVQISVPFPTISDVRHIADIRVDNSGNLYICSSSDPGDNGPFASAVYLAGTFWDSGTEIQFIDNAGLLEIYRSNEHKTEAICRAPTESGGMILGADDENFGGAIFIQGQLVEGILVGNPVTVTRQARSEVSEADAYAKAMACAKREAACEVACRFAARECVTPECSDYFWTMEGEVLVSGFIVSQYPPVCRIGTSRLSFQHASDLAREAAQAAAASYCQ